MAHVNTAIGEGAIYIGEAQYLLRPSFRALSQLGEPENIEYAIGRVNSAYGMLLSGLIPTASTLATCACVVDVCSDIPFDDLGEVVEGRAGGLKWLQGKVPWHDVVILAHHCVRWGVMGDPKEKLSRAAKKKLDAQPKRDFDPAEFVAIMIDEFGMTSSDAWDSTMTEFQRICEHRNRKNWGDRPPPVDDEERDKLLAQYQDCIKRRASNG